MPSLFRLRIAALVFAVLLGGYAAWMLTLAVMRPPQPSFPSTAAGAVSTEADRDRAAGVARRGIIRGDLWADDAISLASGLLDERGREAARPPPVALEAARDAAERAVRLAPHDSRMWLLIAAVDARLGRRPDAALKMSYYTAPNDVALMAPRLRIAIRSEAISDPDLQLLVSGEIRSILKSRPDLKAAIVDAYRDSGAPGRRFIEDVLGNLDPELQTFVRTQVAPL
jgi:hypothetical protein